MADIQKVNLEDIKLRMEKPNGGNDVNQHNQPHINAHQKRKTYRRESAPDNLYAMNYDLLDREGKEKLKISQNSRKKLDLEDDSSAGESEFSRKDKNSSSNKSIVLAIPKSPTNQEAKEKQQNNNPENLLNMNNKLEDSLKKTPNKSKNQNKNESLKPKKQKETLRSRKNSLNEKNLLIEARPKSSVKKIESTGINPDPEKISLQKPKGINLQQKIIKSLNSSGTTYESEKISFQINKGINIENKIEKNPQANNEKVRTLEKKLTKEIKMVNESYEFAPPKIKEFIKEKSENYNFEKAFHLNDCNKAGGLGEIVESFDETNSPDGKAKEDPLSKPYIYDDKRQTRDTYNELRKSLDDSSDNSSIFNNSVSNFQSLMLSETKGKNKLKLPKPKQGCSQRRLSNQSSFVSTEMKHEGIHHHRSYSSLPLGIEHQERSTETENFFSILKDSEMSFLSVLSEDQKERYQELKSKEEEHKIMKIMNCSKAIQCVLITPFDFADKLEKIRRKDKYRLLLEKVFDSPAEINYLTPNLRRELAAALKGHKLSKCSDDCEHLKRAVMVKWKSKGLPYPIRTVKM